ncbi:MAG: TatD family hydrolase [Nitrospirae bacterium]|nr:TatD family hydrolase [Nitrospirota bacterium]
MDIIEEISPNPSFSKRGIIPPFGKGRLGGILQRNVVIILRLLISGSDNAPVPHRGKRNESAYVKHVAEKITEVKGISMEELGRIVMGNASRLFNIPL